MQHEPLYHRIYSDLLLWVLATLAVLIMAVAVRSTAPNRVLNVGWIRNWRIPRMHARPAASRSAIT